MLHASASAGVRLSARLARRRWRCHIVEAIAQVTRQEWRVRAAAVDDG